RAARPEGAQVGLLGGKVAIVSGAGPGLGREVGRALAREGATVVVAARDEARVAALAEELAAAGATAAGLRLDVTDPASCRGVVDEVLDRFRRLDVLVNNAFDE